MIKITQATDKDNLDKEWSILDDVHFRGKINWYEHNYRFKATENQKLIGMIEGKCEPGVVTISTLITIKSSRGQGIGTMLVARAIKFGKKYNAHKVWLITGGDWSENVFYQKLGFKLTGNLPDFYLHTNCVIYTKSI